MLNELFWFSLSGPAVMVFTHVMLHRTILRNLDPNKRIGILVKILIRINLLWGILALVAFWSAPVPERLGAVAYAIVVSGGIAFCYFNFFMMSETARRIRILVDVYVAERTEYEAMGYNHKAREEYNAAAMIDVRIARLLAAHAIQEKDGKLFATSSPMLFASRLVHFWSQLLFGNSSDARTSKDWDRLSKAS
jgi:hypothetical protein